MIISPQAQFVCCGVFSLPNLTILSLLPPAGVLTTGCTPRLQCYPMDFMSLSSPILVWILRGCFCLIESKCISSNEVLSLWNEAVFLAVAPDILNVCFTVCVQAAAARADNLSTDVAHRLHDPIFLLSWTEDLWSLVEQIWQHRPLAHQNIGNISWLTSR